MAADRLVEGERQAHTVRVHPVDCVPSIEGEALVPCADLIELAPDSEWHA